MRAAGLGLCAVATALTVSAAELVDYVRPIVGTDSEHALSNGNLYPAVARPWSMHLWSPQTGEMWNGWIYSYRANRLRGFCCTREPSPWMNDHGRFSVMPAVGKLRFDENDRASWFSHKTETVTPDYYKVYLADHDTTAELVSTERAAILRTTYPETDEAYFVVDASIRGTYVRVEPEKRRVVGWSAFNFGGFGDYFKNHFVVQFDCPIVESKVWLRKSDKHPASVVDGVVSLGGWQTGVSVRFPKMKRGERVTARMAASFIDLEQAERNLREVEGRTVEQVRDESRKAWNDVLGRVVAEGGSEDRMRMFYTCLYRCLLFPLALHEIGADGQPRYRSPMTGEVKSGTYYAGTGFWDTFRALFPLLNFAYPDKAAEFMGGLERCWRDCGWLPEWSSWGIRDSMIGNNSASVVADAWLSGVRGDFDIHELYKALLHGANDVHPKIRACGREGWRDYNELGYVPRDRAGEASARTLEYAYDDWCIWRLGVALGRPKAETDVYLARSRNWRNVFDPSLKLMNGRDSAGRFNPDFNPYKWGGDFVEGTPLHYTWSVFHDVLGLMAAMGGREAFVRRLDEVLSLPPTFDCSHYKRVIHEIREMQIMGFGQYAHGNQPIQHMLYLYDWADAPHKTQYWVREVMDRLYQPTPDGYCGDEDNGQTSAWYVWSALGMYPVCPASGEYALGSPLFRQVTVNRPGRPPLRIVAEGEPGTDRYVRSRRLDGKPFAGNFVKLADLRAGGTFTTTVEASQNRK